MPVLDGRLTAYNGTKKLKGARMRYEKVKVFLLRRWYMVGGAALVLAAAIFYVVSYPASVSTAASTRQLPIYSVERSQRVCAISFDAAWGNEDTQTLIDILEKFHVKTTFFVVGDWAEKYPESVKALHDAGHEVMSHSNHHDHSTASLPIRSSRMSPPATSASPPPAA